ncbi:MAG: hypothetical protein CW338_10035, partial [Clostridiales bacterium]|nr:hypothetical protein [Clostridiales bacterium]
QKAFCPECTLTRDEVSQWLMDDGKCNYYDLQGNLVITGAANFTYSNRFSGDYARVKPNVGYGLIDTTGKLVVRCAYSDIDYYSDHMFATGYVAGYRDGQLGFCDLNGVETYSDFKYASNVVSVTGAFGHVKDLDGSYIIITAAAGELAERFKDYSYFNDQSRLVVLQKNDGSVGVIGLAGEEVIPFSADYRYTSNISVSNDESTILVYDRSKGSGVYVVYTGSYDFEPPVAEEEIVLQPGEWICPACGGVRNTNFCMEDGTMKPATDWFCPGCGTQNISDFNFCPYCGTKRP